MMIWHERSNVVMNILNSGFCHLFAASVEATSTMGWTGLMLWLAAICRFYKNQNKTIYDIYNFPFKFSDDGLDRLIKKKKL